VREPALQCVDVVELDDARGLGGMHRRPDAPFARVHLAVNERDERLVNRAVVAPVEDEDLGAAGDRPGADGEPVRVRRRQCELPARQAEAPAHLPANPERVLARQHQRDPARRLLADRTHRGLGGMAGHRAGVAQAQVDVLVAVHVAKASAARLGGEHRIAARPAHHPVHLHATEQRALRPLDEPVRARVLGAESLELALHESPRRGKTGWLTISVMRPARPGDPRILPARHGAIEPAPASGRAMGAPR
jgi:hypothetical protein